MVDIKITSEKSLFKSPFLELKAENIIINNTSHYTYHNIYRRPAVMVFPITEKYDIYLISQYRYMYKRRVLEAVAGYMEDGEAPLHGAKRELQEEIGVQADNWEHLMTTELAASSIKSSLHLFLATKLTMSKPSREEGEDIDIIKMSLSEAAAKAVSGEIHDAPSIAGILILDKLRREKKI